MNREDTLGSAILSSIKRLSSSQRFVLFSEVKKMDYCYRKGVQISVLCWEVVLISEGLYVILTPAQTLSPLRRHTRNPSEHTPSQPRRDQSRRYRSRSSQGPEISPDGHRPLGGLSSVRPRIELERCKIINIMSYNANRRQ